jgi:hypothetical protein
MRKNKPNPRLSATEQQKVNQEWERMNKQKLPKGENAKLAEGDYERWKKGQSHGTYYMGPEEKPAKRSVEIGKLATKPLQTSSAKATLQRQQKRKPISPPVEPKFKPEVKTKKLTATATATGNVYTGVRNVVNKQRFEAEKRKNEALKRTSKGMGSDVSLSALKEKKADLKQIKKTPAARTEIKDTRKAISLKKAQSKGKTKYFK